VRAGVDAAAVVAARRLGAERVLGPDALVGLALRHRDAGVEEVVAGRDAALGVLELGVFGRRGDARRGLIVVLWVCSNVIPSLRGVGGSGSSSSSSSMVALDGGLELSSRTVEPPHSTHRMTPRYFSGWPVAGFGGLRPS
jgi:hypothetical protein